MALRVKTYLDKTPGIGIGLYADENIKKGMTVYGFDPAMDLRIHAAVAIGLPELQYDFVRRYGCRRDNWYVVYVDNGRFINHNEYGNCEIDEYHNIIASEDIKIGDEILIDYSLICDDYKETSKFWDEKR